MPSNITHMCRAFCGVSVKVIGRRGSNKEYETLETGDMNEELLVYESL